MMKKKYPKMSNIVRIGNLENLEKYFYSIIMRMNPQIYKEPEHQCIIIQVKASLLDFADLIIRRFRYAGLKEVSRKHKPLKDDIKGITIPDGWEIKLIKIPTLEAMEATEDD